MQRRQSIRQLSTSDKTEIIGLGNDETKRPSGVDMTKPLQRYYWLPVVDESSSGGMVRHAFRGTYADASANGDSFCDKRFCLAKPSEMDWIQAPSCQDCNSLLKALKG